MRSRSDPWLVLAGAALLFAGCGNFPGKPIPDDMPTDPDNITDFNVLFRANCSGCHGAEGKGGAALSIADPVYLAIADDALLHHVITNGIAGTSMPAFAKSAGGMLTDQQVDIIARGLREHYAKADALAGAEAPFYMSMEEGDSKRGAQVYATFCASCHGPNGKGGSKAGPIVDGSLLALLTDQELRTLVIVGRPDLGAPDWRNNIPGKPMSSQEISDVVAWLSAQRPQFAGSPYPVTAKSAGDHP
jgi:mono/diheme cytochrome c family protein